jgi:hypothetical protein
MSPAERSAWKKVSFGVFLVGMVTIFPLIGVVIAIGILLTAWFIPEIGRDFLRPGQAPDAGENAFSLLLSGLVYLTTLGGRALCCNAPAASGARGMAFTSLAATLLAIVGGGFAVFALTSFAAVGGTPPQWVLLAVLFTGVLALGAEVTYLLFLLQLGWFFDSPKLVRGVQGFCGFVVANLLVAVLVGAAVVASLTQRPSPWGGMAQPPAQQPPGRNRGPDRRRAWVRAARLRPGARVLHRLEPAGAKGDRRRPAADAAG